MLRLLTVGLAAWLVLSVLLALAVGTTIAAAGRDPIWRRVSARAAARVIGLDYWLAASRHKASGRA